MITLPDPVPVAADLSSPDRFLWSLARRQLRPLLGAIGFGTAWMLTIAVVPGVLGRTIDAGVVGRDGGALVTGCLVLLALGVVQAATGTMRHRFAVANWLLGSSRTAQLVGHHVSDQGVAVAGTTTTGEAISTATDDPPRIADLFDILARFFGGIVAWVLVTVIVLRIDQPLGLLVAAGVPLLSASLILVVRPLTARQKVHRATEGELAALGADTVAGLRVLRGIGGEDQFLSRYVGRSQEVRRAGSRVAGPQATLDAAQVLLPSLFTLVFVWLGARAAVGGRVSPGELVALYGYAAFLRLPLDVAGETLGKTVRARVAAGRVIRVLATRGAPETATASPTTDPPAGSVVEDVVTGLRLAPGSFTALVSGSPGEAAAVADRLARLTPDDPPLIGTVSAADLATDDVRRRILVSEAEPQLFSGTLRETLDPAGTRPDGDLLAAMEVADAGDVLDGLPGALDGRVEERGRSLSGGQRQRLALARAVLAEPEVLVLVEPTSAVDAHTEARIGGRLRAARAGRTTLVTTTSPLLLDRAERVAFLAGGRVAALGPHRELLRTVPEYRETVTRGEDS